MVFALVIDMPNPLNERQTLGEVQRTFVCQELTWGGCCRGFDEVGFGTGCE